MRRESIAVVIPVYNRAAYVAQTLASVAAQTRQPDELIVVDDGSTDETAKVVARCRRRYRLPLRWIAQEHAGTTVAMNRGIQATDCTLVAVLDSDDLCHPRRLELQESLFRQRPELVLVGSSVQCIDAQGTCLHHRREVCDDLSLRLRLLFKCPMAHPATMLRRDAWQRAGGYDTSFRYAHDYELFSRMAHHGQLANCPQRLLRYRVHPHSITGSRRMEQLAEVRRISIRNLLDAGLADSEQEAMVLRLLVGVEKYAELGPGLSRRRLLDLADRLSERFSASPDPRLRRWTRRAYRNAIRYSRPRTEADATLRLWWRGMRGMLRPYPRRRFRKCG